MGAFRRIAGWSRGLELRLASVPGATKRVATTLRRDIVIDTVECVTRIPDATVEACRFTAMAASRAAGGSDGTAAGRDLTMQSSLDTGD